MQTIPAQEIKRRGISAVDDLLREGPVHVIQRNQPRYVILDEVRYRETWKPRKRLTLLASRYPWPRSKLAKCFTLKRLRS